MKVTREKCSGNHDPTFILTTPERLRLRASTKTDFDKKRHRRFSGGCNRRYVYENAHYRRKEFPTRKRASCFIKSVWNILLWKNQSCQCIKGNWLQVEKFYSSMQILLLGDVRRFVKAEEIVWVDKTWMPIIVPCTDDTVQGTMKAPVG